MSVEREGVGDGVFMLFVGWGGSLRDVARGIRHGGVRKRRARRRGLHKARDKISIFDSNPLYLYGLR